MNQPNNHDSGGEHFIRELEARLRLAGKPEAKLDAYLHYLPEIVLASPEQALELAAAAERIATERCNWDARAELLRLRGEAHLGRDNPVAALGELHKALELARDGGDGLAMARISIATGRAYEMLGDPVNALVTYQHALDRRGEEPSTTRADLLEALADLHLSTGDYARAIERIGESLSIRNAFDQSDGIGRALAMTGIAYGRLGDLDKSCEYHERSLEAFRAAGDVTNEIRTLANLANIHKTRGEVREALDLAWRAHAACETTGDKATQASLRITIADLYLQGNDETRAEQYYREAREFLGGHEDDDLYLELCLRFGGYYERTHDLDHARRIFHHAIQIAERNGRRQAEAELRLALSRVFERLGLYSDALAQYQHYTTLRLELASEEQRREIDEIQTGYRMKEMEQDLARAHEQRALAEARAVLAMEKAEKTQMELVEKQMEIMDIRKAAEERDSSSAEDSVHGASNNEEGSKKQSRRRKNSAIDHGWEQLKRDVERAHPGFLERLHRRCLTLTEVEIRICTLTRLLGDDSNEIARRLGNKLRTLQTQRGTIRSKLKLEPNENFVAFITSL
jgi:tetratricopeptide (TPR) repeat protein